MSTDLRPHLQRARDRAPDADFGLEALRRRRDRRAATRRLTAGAVSFAIGTAAVVGVWVNFRAADAPRIGRPMGLELPAGSFYYEEVHHYNLVDYRDDPPIEFASEQLWLAPDGSGRFVFHGHIINYAPITGGEREQDMAFSPGEAPWAWVDLPTDTTGMRQALVDRSAPGGESPVAAVTPTPGIDADGWRIVSAAGDLFDRLDLYLAPPQRRTLFEVLRELSFFRVIEGAVDPLGRSATELQIRVSDGYVTRWFFDAESGQWLARMVESAETGDVLTAEIMVRSGVASSTETTRLDPSFVQHPVVRRPDFVPDGWTPPQGVTS